MIVAAVAAAWAFSLSGGMHGVGSLGKLTFHETEDYKKAWSLYGGLGYTLSVGRKPDGYVAPKGAKDPVFLEFRMISGKTYVAVVGKSKAGLARPDLLWVDWNNDKKFEDDEKARPFLETDRYTAFKPVADPRIGGRPVHIGFRLGLGPYLSALASGYMGATVSLGGKLVKVGIVDANGNGVYGDFESQHEHGDVLLVDRNGNGKFDPDGDSNDSSYFDGESLPLSAFMRFGGETLYEVVVTGNSRIEFKPYRGPFGDMVFEGMKRGFAVVSSPKGGMYVRPTDGKCRLPFGAYGIQRMEYEVADPAGKEWKLIVTGSAGRPLSVASGKPCVVKCGFPLSVFVSHSPAGEAHHFNLTIRDATGCSLLFLGDAGLATPHVPRLTITDASGAVVDSLDFKYG